MVRARSRCPNSSIVIGRYKRKGAPNRCAMISNHEEHEEREAYKPSCPSRPSWFTSSAPLERHMEAELHDARLIRRCQVRRGQPELRRVAERRRVQTVVGVIEDVEDFDQAVAVTA